MRTSSPDKNETVLVAIFACWLYQENAEYPKFYTQLKILSLGVMSALSFEAVVSLGLLLRNFAEQCLTAEVWLCRQPLVA